MLDWLCTGDATFLYWSEILLGLRNLNGDKTEGVIILKCSSMRFSFRLIQGKIDKRQSKSQPEKNMLTTDCWYGHLHVHSNF